jgi:F-type H+-transporting ATPase subunit b
MLIDWFTVLAQALNFLILLWLMKRFLYAPILHAIDAREQRIAAELKDADARKAEAKGEREEFERKNKSFNQQRSQLLSKATDEVEKQRQVMLKQAHEAADNWTAKRHEALQAQADGLSRAIEDSARSEVLAITRKALQDLATSDLESSMAGILMRRLRALDGQAKADLVAALGSATTSPIVSSAFALPAKQQAEIQKVVQELLASDAPLRFEVRPELVCGIELSANGQLVAWNIDSYLQSLKKEIGRIASERETQASSAAPAANVQEEPSRKVADTANTDADGDPSAIAVKRARADAA